MEEAKVARAREADKYCDEKMGFVPRMLSTISNISPDFSERFADLYEVMYKDNHLTRKIKELMTIAIAVTYQSPACLAHVVPAIRAGATDDEIFETLQMASFYVGNVPAGVGMPYAFAYANKVLEIAQKYRNGEDWEYLTEPSWSMGR